ncbi:MAG: DUF3999 domain-containing protein [bacterium]|nr:DUF3999 domain-containing protein [bacterium]
MRRAIGVALWIASVAATASAGAATPDLRTLFPQQVDLHADDDRLSRLVLPVEVIKACRRDLSDLRVFDADGREVPFLVDGGPQPDTRVEVRRSFTPELLEVSRGRPGGDEAPRRTVETYEIAAPPEVSPTGFWDLVIDARAASYVRRILVTARTADGAESRLAEGSIFRLTEPPREKTRLTLPAFTGRVRVTLEGEEGAFLDPGLSYQSTRSFPTARRARLELEKLSQRSADRRTLLEAARPGGVVPDLLLLETSTAAFNRRVEVWDDGPGAAREKLGARILFRLPAPVPVEELEIPLRPARGDRLRVVIADGDSSPLEDLAVSAVVRRPALLLSLPATDGARPAGILRFGGGRAFRPQYDLAALPLKLPVSGSEVEVVERLYDPALLGEIRTGTIEPNPEFDPAPVLAFAHRPGSAIEVEPYSHRRRLRVTASAEGLARYRLTVEDLALARADLADLRIVDGEGRQWAYLLEPDAARDLRLLAPSPPATEDGTSRYALSLPVTPAKIEEIVLDTPVPFFDRDFELVEPRGETEETLAHGRLARRAGDPRPVRITFGARRLEALELRIRDGDDAPLLLERVEARFPVAELYFAAPPGEYTLLLGHPEDRRPSYELARVRAVVLAVAGSPATAAVLERNPDHDPRSRFATDAGLQRLLLWIALAAAVAVLTLLTLRLARRAPDEPRDG